MNNYMMIMKSILPYVVLRKRFYLKLILHYKATQLIIRVIIYFSIKLYISQRNSKEKF